MIKDLTNGWHYIYGKGSHMNLAGKIILGIPIFPFAFIMVFTYALLNSIFTKKEDKK
jgi:hypothetical protein